MTLFFPTFFSCFTLTITRSEGTSSSTQIYTRIGEALSRPPHLDQDPNLQIK